VPWLKLLRLEPFSSVVVASIGSGSSLMSGMSYAEDGIRSSVERFENASAEVTRQATALSSGTGDANATDAGNDIGQAMVDQKLAAFGISANVKTVQAFDDMLRELTLMGRD
jgi:hypothetical protein